VIDGKHTEMTGLTLSNINDFVGRELGVSSWMTVDQSRINQFADCTGDHQWIHVDVDRARRESPFGNPVAHGYLMLSLIAPLAMEIGVLPTDAAAGFNYGLDKVRFPAPVKAGARVRLRVVLVGVEPKDAGQLVIKMRNTMEIDGSDKPAVVAETLALLVPGKAAGAGEPR
jgi:acyl dehydratase